MQPITANYNCEQSELYAIGGLAWASCGQNLAAFTNFSERYTQAFIDMEVLRIESAESIPSAQARQAVAEILRTQLLVMAEDCRDKWQLLKRYITKSVTEEALKASLEAAGSKEYLKASDNNWDKVRALNAAAISYMADNLTALTANDNMPATFGAPYNTLKLEFAALYQSFLDAQETAKQGTQTKIAANNIVHKNLMDMMLDGQQIFKKDPMRAEQFVFATVQELVSSASPAGIKGTINNEDDGNPIVGAVVRILTTEKTATSDETGHYEISGVPNDTYTIVCSAEGFADKIIDSFKIKLGTVSTLDITLTPS